MSGTSKIEWTDASWNPIRARDLETGKVGWHCEHVSEGCRHCYAETMNRRLGTGLKYLPSLRGSRVELYLDEQALLAPLHWRKPRRVFVCSMTDLFADFVTDAMIDRVLAVIALCPQHTFQVLTKRPERLREYMESSDEKTPILRVGREMRNIGGNPKGRLVRPWPLPNLWMGVSAENQATLDERIPDLLATPAALRFVSLEPLLGAVDATHVCNVPADGISPDVGRNVLTGRGYPSEAFSDQHSGERLDWVIVGGESGPGARPMHPHWARQVRDQCAAAGVAYFFKQWGEHFPLSQYVDSWPGKNSDVFNYAGKVTEIREHGERFIHAGKKKAGALLDGVEHKDFP